MLPTRSVSRFRAVGAVASAAMSSARAMTEHARDHDAPWTRTVCSGRTDQRQLGEIASIATGVARQKRVTAHGGMRTDVEIRERCVLRPSPAAMGQERLARQKGRIPRQLLALEFLRQCRLQVFDAAKPTLTSAKMIGFIARSEDSAASASAA